MLLWSTVALIPSVIFIVTCKSASDFYGKVPLDKTAWNLRGEAAFLADDPESYLFAKTPRIRLVQQPSEHLSFGALWNKSPVSNKMLLKSVDWQLDVLFTGRGFLHGQEVVGIVLASEDSILNESLGFNKSTIDAIVVAVSTQYKQDPLRPDISLKMAISVSNITNSTSPPTAFNRKVNCWTFSILDLLNRRTRLTFQKLGSELKVIYLDPCGHKKTHLKQDISSFLNSNTQFHFGAIASSNGFFGKQLDLVMFEFSPVENSTMIHPNDDLLSTFLKDMKLAQRNVSIPEFVEKASVPKLTQVYQRYEPVPLPSPPLFYQKQVKKPKKSRKIKTYDDDDSSRDRSQESNKSEESYESRESSED